MFSMLYDLQENDSARVSGRPVARRGRRSPTCRPAAASVEVPGCPSEGGTQMKLTVFGATGGTGKQVVSQALAAGHEVLAVVRDSCRLAVPAHAGLDVAVADVLDPAAIGDLVAGRDAVISTVGPSRRPEEKNTRAAPVCSASARSITAAMRATGTGRLVVVSASGPFTDG